MSSVPVNRLEVARDMAAGYRAGKAGEPVTACPFDPAGEPTEQFRVAAWMRGYVRAGNA